MLFFVNEAPRIILYNRFILFESKLKARLPPKPTSHPSQNRADPNVENYNYDRAEIKFFISGIIILSFLSQKPADENFFW